MMDIVFILLVSVLFLGLLLNLATENQLRKRLNSISVVVAAVIGVACYGYGFFHVFGFSPISVFRALLAICRMFAGVNDLASIQSVALFQNNLVLSVFWMGHFLAFYVTASTVVAALGGKLLYTIRSFLVKRRDLLVVFGVSNETLIYARRMLQQHRMMLLFVDKSCEPALESAVISLGGIVEKSASALKPDASFLRQTGIRPGRKRVLFAAMSTDSTQNLLWAKQLQEALASCGIHPEQASLLLRGIEEQQAGDFLEHGDTGFGTVYAYNEYDLAARLMVSRLPPCDTIRFNEVGKAEEDFTAAIVGFGQMGRAALRQLLMNGQFEGSTFRVDLFDPQMEMGSLSGSRIVDHYRIQFHACSGQFESFYDFLRDRGTKLKYIVLSTGNQQKNREIAQEIEEWYSGMDHKPAIVQITRGGLLCSFAEKTDLSYQEIYDSDAMDLEKMDHLAMIINQQYCAGNGKTAEENWKACDYFSRMSCRASADFAGAILKAAGKTKEELICGEWKPEGELLETLSMTEHRRWCAFHEVMGYRPMDPSVWQERSVAYAAQKAQQGSSSIRIGKDAQHKLHACLTPWDSLDELSARENRVTGGHVDYKEMDRQNVLALQELLKAQAAQETGC